MATVDTQMCLNVTLYVHPCLVLYCHIALSEHQILFQTWDSSFRNIQNAWNFVQVKLYLICMSLNALNVQSDMSPLKIFVGVTGSQLLKFCNKL